MDGEVEVRWRDGMGEEGEEDGEEDGEEGGQ
jgi:hypothetical protein